MKQIQFFVGLVLCVTTFSRIFAGGNNPEACGQVRGLAREAVILNLATRKIAKRTAVEMERFVHRLNVDDPESVTVYAVVSNIGIHPGADSSPIRNIQIAASMARITLISLLGARSGKAGQQGDAIVYQLTGPRGKLGEVLARTENQTLENFEFQRQNPAGLRWVGATNPLAAKRQPRPAPRRSRPWTQG